MAYLPEENAMSAVNGLPGANIQAAATEEILVVFDQATVDLDALQRSAYAVAAQMTVDIRAFDSDYVCTLFPREHAPAADELKHRFRSEVNDQILRARIAKETELLRNLVFALAFSRTGLADSDVDADAAAGA
jgi:His-Xaa-Ser system protein HxsD